MTNPIVKIHNSETGEDIERPMTEAELADYEAYCAEEAAKALAEEERQTKRSEALAKLEALGMTEEDFKALQG